MVLKGNYSLYLATCKWFCWNLIIIAK
jgi:hypothetical protein